MNETTNNPFLMFIRIEKLFSVPNKTSNDGHTHCIERT